MKKLLVFIALIFSSLCGYSQAYIPMPSDSAVWRYRINNIDFVTHIYDNILFVNGTDTVISGLTYHKIISRSYNRVVPNGYYPAVVTDTANMPDIYYGAIRESGKKVFLAQISGAQLIFDYNAVVGDSIPAYSGKIRVVAIDSVLLSGIYHKRYLTTDPGYSVIEGVGSSRGLIPDINDGSGSVQFFCFTYSTVTYTPDSAFACTYVYPIGYLSVINNVNKQEDGFEIFPNPVSELLHITATGNDPAHVMVLNSIGQVMWHGMTNGNGDIQVSEWPHGVYYIKFTRMGTSSTVKKFTVN